jgi:hypothetical protein
MLERHPLVQLAAQHAAPADAVARCIVRDTAPAPLSGYPLARLEEAPSPPMLHLQTPRHPAAFATLRGLSPRAGVRGQGPRAGRVVALPCRTPVGKAFQ